MSEHELIEQKLLQTSLLQSILKRDKPVGKRIQDHGNHRRQSVNLDFVDTLGKGINKQRKQMMIFDLKKRLQKSLLKDCDRAQKVQRQGAFTLFQGNNRSRITAAYNSDETVSHSIGNKEQYWDSEAKWQDDWPSMHVRQ